MRGENLVFSVRLVRASGAFKTKSAFYDHVSLCVMLGKGINLMHEALEIISSKEFPSETVFGFSVCRP